MSANRRQNLRFAVVMAAFVGVVLLTYREHVLGALLAHLAAVTARTTLALLHWSGMEAVLVGTQIHHPDGFAYDIYYRCTGFLPVAFLAVAILAYAAPLRHKWIGLAVGVPTLMAFNLTRLVHLFYVGVHDPTAFHVTHSVLWEGLIIIAVFALWWGWARWSDSRTRTAQANERLPEASYQGAGH